MAAARPVVTPQPDRVLVKVAYAGTNGPDIMQRKGLYPLPEDASNPLSLEMAGEIVDA
jgi:NADPH2:quinone reductase